MTSTMMTDNLGEIKRLPINEIAARLGIKVLRGNKAMCFGGHDKVTPSLSFWSAKNRWKCFGCGLGGGVIDLVMKVRQVDFKTALDWFAFEFGIGVRRNQRGSSYFKVDRSFRRLPTLPPQPLQSRGSSDSESGFRADPELYTWLLGKCGPVSECTGLDYLLSHAISRDAAAQFRVRELRKTMVAFRSLLEHWGAGRLFRSGLAFGLAGKPQRLIWPSYTLLFPFVQGDAVVYLQGRQFQREPKFLNLKSIPKPLYNQDRHSHFRWGLLSISAKACPEPSRWNHVACPPSQHLAPVHLGPSGWSGSCHTTSF